MKKIEDFTGKMVKKYKEKREKNQKFTVITIPTVVHVVYNTNVENISDEQVISQIDVLNADFRRLNSDADGTWTQAADTEIEFCLATVDPNGNPTDGITRTYTSRTSFALNDDSIKSSSTGGKDAWDTSEYLNIWVGTLQGGDLGYTQFPGGGSALTDGVVTTTTAFGTANAPNGETFNLSLYYNLGRTTTHEVGHWLNLRHIWGDGNCTADDFVQDTPTSDASNYDCSNHVSCNTVDMVQNYMDYTNDSCMNLFTIGQKDRMRALFEVGGFRRSLLSSPGCGGTRAPTGRSNNRSRFGPKSGG